MTIDRRPRPSRGCSAGPARGRVLAGSVAIMVGGFLLGGCGLQPATSYVPEANPGSITPIDGAEGQSLTVTSKNFTEQLILGKISVLAAQAAGFDVTDLTNAPGSQPVRDLMLSGAADFTWEYTGTAWLAFLGQESGIADKDAQWTAVRDADLPNGLVWGKPAPLNNTYAMAVRTEAVEELGGISTMSDLTTLPPEERTFCVEAEFNSRADGMTPMLQHYGLERGTATGVPDGNIGIYDTGAAYTATDNGACNFGEVFATDGRIDALDLTVLKDDLGFFPAYNAAPVYSAETLAKYPELQDVFARITPKLTDETLRSMNLRVDVDGAEPADVAFDFMIDNGFITAR